MEVPGARSPETETIYSQFHSGRENSKERVTRLAQRLDELAPVNRAMALGRVPLLTARIIRALDKLGLIGTAIDVVGTNALFVYERMAGVHITSGLLSTQDVDLLMDSRFSLRLIAKDFSHKGLIGLLQKIDHSFVPLAKNSYRAANRDGFLVDLIKPDPKNVMSRRESHVSALMPKICRRSKSRGFHGWSTVRKRGCSNRSARLPVEPIPVQIPGRLHCINCGLSRRADRDAAKRIRDGQQARIVAELISTRLPHLSFESNDLQALPLALRQLATELVPVKGNSNEELHLTPNW